MIAHFWREMPEWTLSFSREKYSFHSDISFHKGVFIVLYGFNIIEKTSRENSKRWSLMSGFELAWVPRVPGTGWNSEHHLWHPQILRFSQSWVLNTKMHPQSSFYVTSGTLRFKFLTQALNVIIERFWPHCEVILLKLNPHFKHSSTCGSVINCF